MNRNNCGCAPYNPNTNRIDYIKELHDTCDCVLPCESCECVEQTGACPPPPPRKPVQRMKCCVEKPKKSFWQLLFGNKKCSPSLKKKHDKKRKQVTKLNCVPLPNSDNELCEDNVDGQQTSGNLNSNSCPRKECFPTPKSICGCHFYFNIENRPKRHALTVATGDQKIFDNNETPLEYGYDINEAPERDNLDTNRFKEHNAKSDKRKNTPQNMLSSPYDKRIEGNKSSPQGYYSTHNKRNSANERKSSVGFRSYEGQTRRSGNNGWRKSSRCNRKSISSLPTEKRSKNDVHIGLTFTKEETKYYMPNDDTCLSLFPEQKSNGECKNSQRDDSKENAEQLLTVEIHKSSVKVSQNGDVEEVASDDELDGDNKPKQIPRSESALRELRLLKKKGQREGMLSMSGDEAEQIDNNRRQHTNKRTSLVSTGYSKANLDRRVSEILKKLNEIENKINIIEMKEQDNKKIRVDFDGAKSTVSLHIKDPTNENFDDGNNYNNNSKRDNGNTVIEIRHTQSKSPPTARRSFQEDEPRPSQSLDDYNKNQSSSHKIVIKLPKNSAKTQCFVLPEKQNSKGNENCKQTISWYNVSDELKCSPLTVQKQCYCYECVQKRLRCM